MRLAARSTSSLVATLVGELRAAQNASEATRFVCVWRICARANASKSSCVAQDHFNKIIKAAKGCAWAD